MEMIFSGVLVLLERLFDNKFRFGENLMQDELMNHGKILYMIV